MDYRQLRYRVEKYSTFSRASRCLCKHPDSVKLMSWSSSTKRALTGFTAVCNKKESEPPRTRTWNLVIKSPKRCVLARTRPFGNYNVLQVFYEIRRSNSSIPYACVLVRLQ